ncbi:MAG: ShlB/FhaC/HecB family hemolysin secretion/activation protein [Chloroflexi bacterium AL-N10]|nr:ShlB/FhaC/HecB family hemolysin secretion/activation protein [Chloroflexi bacterium AL-N10]NOK92752.1 ShlB/FhaC/HecB family hemolysin secretion/activation protein [Chloroflexi bacterium AL-N15]
MVIKPHFYRFLLLFWGFSSILALKVDNSWAQQIEPLTPRKPEQIEPKPLPPPENNLQISPLKPPTPEEVLEIPGTIVVEEFEFIGNTAFSQEELRQVIADFTGKPITFAQLIQAANAITELYIIQGYITSGAYIPSQELRSNTVKIQIVEGSLEAINVNILKGRLSENYVRSRLSLATSAPLNVNRLQSALQLLQLDPLIESLNVELSAGTKAGTNALDVAVIGAKTFNLQVQLNNNRNPSVGSFERGGEISEANLLGLGDSIKFAYNNTDGSDDFAGGYSIPLNAQNGSVSFQFRIANSDIIEPPFNDIDNDGSEPDLEVHTREFDLTFRQPIIQRITPEVIQELTLSLSASRRESDSSILGVKSALFPGANEEGETRISALRFAQEWTQRNRQEVLSTRSQFNLGIGAFGSTINDREPDSRFFAWQGQLLYLRLLGDVTDSSAFNPTLFLRSNLQLAANSLLSSEQFSLGGQSTVRGYRQDSRLTDNGIFVSAEMRLPIFKVPDIEGSLQLAPFIDFGTGWNTGRDTQNPNTLVGMGLGLLWQMGDQFTARFDWGIPLVDIDSGDRTWQENGIYFQIEYNPF